jgi:tetratricopeptide (TPR) repeat protein
MNILKQSFLAILAMGLLGVLVTNAQAQEQRRAAVQAYNKASELAKNDQLEQAITKFEEAIEAGQAAEEAGEEGADIVERSKSKLPALHYDQAISAYRSFQSSRTTSSLDETIQAFQEASDVASQYGNQSIADKATGNITQLMYSKSVLQYSQQNFEDALATIDQVIERNSNFPKAYFHKGLIYKKMDGNFDQALSLFDQAIDLGEKNDDPQIVRKAKENATGELVFRGATAIKDKKYTSAIELLNRALEYDPESADANYRLAEAYNNRGEWGQGMKYARRALDLENGGRTSKAKIYFEIASAYKGQGQFNQACDAYSNAAYGQFKQQAEHQMEFELECGE